MYLRTAPKWSSPDRWSSECEVQHFKCSCCEYVQRLLYFRVTILECRNPFCRLASLECQSQPAHRWSKAHSQMTDEWMLVNGTKHQHVHVEVAVQSMLQGLQKAAENKQATILSVIGWNVHLLHQACPPGVFQFFHFTRWSATLWDPILFPTTLFRCSWHPNVATCRYRQEALQGMRTLPHQMPLSSERCRHWCVYRKALHMRLKRALSAYVITCAFLAFSESHPHFGRIRSHVAPNTTAYHAVSRS